MQDRAQSGSRLSDLLATATFAGLLPLGRLLSRSIVDRRRAWEVSDAIAGAFLALRPGYRAALEGNAAQVLGLPPEHPCSQALATRVARNHLRAWVDYFHFGQKPTADALALLDTSEGEGHLHAARAAGKGVILLTAHAGNFELGALLLRVWDLKVHAVYKPDRFPAVERLRAEIRAQGGVEGVPVGEGPYATLPLVKLLREGHLVGMQGDRDFNLNGLPLTFLGREAFFPRGPWELAAMTGAPVVVSFFHTDEEGRFHAKFFEPIPIEGERGLRQASIQAGMARYVALLEGLVRAHPDQWNCFYPFWDDPLRR